MPEFRPSIVTVNKWSIRLLICHKTEKYVKLLDVEIAFFNTDRPQKQTSGKIQLFLDVKRWSDQEQIESLISMVGDVDKRLVRKCRDFFFFVIRQHVWNTRNR